MAAYTRLKLAFCQHHGMAAGMFWLSLAVVLLTLSVSCPATAADVSSGLALAEKNCERCHAIGKTGKSKHAEAPPFGEVVTRYPPASLAEALAEGISTGHRDMPEFVFSPDEIGDLIAYLESLQ